MPIRVTHGIDMERLGRLAFRAGRGQRRQEVADRQTAVKQQRQLEAFTRDLTARIQQERDTRLRQFDVQDREDAQAQALTVMASQQRAAQLEDQVEFQRKLDDDRVKWIQREAPKLNPQDRREVYAALSDISRIRNDQTLTSQQRPIALEQRLTEAEERVRNAARPEDRWGPGKQDGDTWIDENTGATFTRTDGKVTKVESAPKPEKETTPPTYREWLRSDSDTVSSALDDARELLTAQAEAKADAATVAAKAKDKKAKDVAPRVISEKEVMDLAEKNLKAMYERFYKPPTPPNPLSGGGTPVEDIAGQLAAEAEVAEQQRQGAMMAPAASAPAPAMAPDGGPPIQSGRLRARNQAGEWLYSDDGGKTWLQADGTPVRG